MVLGVPVWALLVLAAAVGGWALLLFVLTTATRPRPVRPGPATLDLPGEEPPAIVNLLTNGWRPTPDAMSATLLDLAARDMIDLLQTGPEPERTVCRIREPAPPHLTPYERRVYDRVAGLAAGGVVPVAALPQGNSTQANRWWKAFRREVILDAQRRGLSRNRWDASTKSLLAVASAVPAAAVALVVYHAADDSGAIWGTAIFAWGAFSTYARSRNRQRDTPAGREVAARWMGVRDHLGRNDVFDTLPPAAVAIWDRYLGYGAAGGVAGTASRVLSFGAQDERLAWSAYGGTWHKVRIRYPGARAAEGRHPLLAALIGILAVLAGWYGTRGVLALRRTLDEGGLGLPEDTERRLDGPWTDVVLLALGTGLAVVGVWGAWVVVRAVLDLTSRRTFEAEVLRIRTVRNDDGVELEHQVALDDGRSERTRAWSITAKRTPPVDERDVVSVTVGPWLHYVYAMTVVRRGTTVPLVEYDTDLDSQVIEEPVPAGDPWTAALNRPATGPDPASLFTAAELSSALGRPMNPPTSLQASAFGALGMRMAEYAALNGRARVLVQVATGRFAGAVGADRGELLPGGARLRDGSVVIRIPDAVVAIHIRHVDRPTTATALRHLAALATTRLPQPTPTRPT